MTVPAQAGAPGGTRQATVRRYEAADRGGEAVLDDGTPVRLLPGSLDPALRALRPGQRVVLAGLVDGSAAAVTLPHLPVPAVGEDAVRADEEGSP